MTFNEFVILASLGFIAFSVGVSLGIFAGYEAGFAAGYSLGRVDEAAGTRSPNAPPVEPEDVL
jgi:hypothetical protein